MSVDAMTIGCTRAKRNLFRKRITSFSRPFGFQHLRIEMRSASRINDYGSTVMCRKLAVS
jgi:hypothetical protein